MEDGIPGGLQHCHETCCEKGGRRGRRACRVQRWHHRGDVVFWTGGLVYDSEPTTTLGVARLKRFAILASKSQKMAPLNSGIIEEGFPSV